jgi:acyl dehydratase
MAPGEGALSGLAPEPGEPRDTIEASRTTTQESPASMVPKMVVPDVASLREHVGASLGPSDWVEVTQKRIELFAEATGDEQWIHLDEERARRESPFGSTVAHGYLTLSLAPMLLAQCFRVDSVRLTVNYGLEKLRLQAPVLSGSRVRFVGELKAVRLMPGGAARVVIGMTIELENSRKPAGTADAVLVYLPEHPETASE